MKRKNIFSLLLVLALLLGTVQPALAADTAATMQLSSVQGTVKVTNPSGRGLSLRSNMRLYSGYQVETLGKSYAWINLDNSKLIKLDASSKAEIRKSGKKLEVLLKSGNMYGDVSKPLGQDETLNIRTSTAIVGIRGTKFSVAQVRSAPQDSQEKAAERWITQVQVYEGTVSVRAQQETPDAPEAAPVMVTTTLTAGNQLVVDPAAERETEVFTVTALAAVDISGSAAVELAQEPEPLQELGIDLSPEAARELLERDQAEAQQRQAEAESAQTGLETEAAPNIVWDGAADPPSEGGGGGGTTVPDPTPAPTPEPTPGSTYTVTFDPNGGTLTGGSTAVTSVEGKLSTLPAPTRDANTGATASYTFEGWYTAAEGGTQVTADTTFSANATVYAHWTMGSGWDWALNSGALRISGSGAMSDFAASSPPWSGNAGDITSVTIDSGITSVGMSAFIGFTNLTRITLPQSITSIGSYAFQDCNKLANVSFSGTPAFEELGLGMNVFLNCTALTSFTVPSGVIEVQQYTFSGCTSLTTVTIPASATAVSAEAFDGCTGLTDITFGGTKAQWNAFSYKAPDDVTVTCSDGILPEYVVTFDSQGGSAVASQTVAKGGTATEPADPTRTNYTFGGWSLDGATAYNFSTPVTGNITLTALWTPLPTYTVTFNTDGGSAVDSQTVSYGSTVTKPTDPTKTSKVFYGWYTDQTYQTEFSFDTPVTQDVTVYALWMNYSVIFDTNGGIGGATLMVDDSGVLTDLPNPPSYSGKTFSGWNTAADGSGTPISQDALSTYKFTENTTLYAQWN